MCTTPTLPSPRRGEGDNQVVVANYDAFCETLPSSWRDAVRARWVIGARSVRATTRAACPGSRSANVAGLSPARGDNIDPGKAITNPDMGRSM